MARSRHKGRTYVGVSGWTYAGWRRVFYPEGLVQRRELEYLSERMSSVEINGSFYSLQRPTSYRRWYEQTPEGFVFAVKGSRFITHMRKLREPEAPVANFFASGVLRLAEKLGPILWQFPEQLRFDEERFAHFLEILPRTHAAAADIARRHDYRLEGRVWLEAEHEGPIRHAFEVRNPGFLTSDFLKLLRRHDAALVFADSGGRWPYAEDLTARWVYIRLHGAEELYASGYSDADLNAWARRIRAWRDGRASRRTHLVLPPAPDRASGRDVYVYFDNDAKVHAPFDALRLAERLKH